MHFVVIDLVPALLSWEGRDVFTSAEAARGAQEFVDDLFTDFRLAAVADGDHPASAVREAMERLDLAPFFESIGTSSVFGPEVTPRVIRRITRALGAEWRSIVLTGRPELAEALYLSGIPTVEAGGDLRAAAAEIRRMASGRVNP